MKINALIASCLLFTIPLCANAGWEVSKPESSIPREPFFQAGNQKKTTFAPVPVHAGVPYAASIPTAYSVKSFPNQYANFGQAAPVYALSISGSLKENLERILGRYHWKVIWKAENDYNFDGKVTGSSLPNVIEKLLQPFPLQAVMYMSNRTVAIVPRRA